MKSFYIHIIPFFCLLLLLSCAGESKQADSNAEYEDTPTESAKEQVNFNINIHQLNAAQLLAFKVRAKQKVKDFADYIKIISDPKVEKDFKTHSINLATELFISDTVLIKDSLLTNAGGVPLIQYLNELSNAKKNTIIIPKKINFSDSFSIDSLNNYTGTIDTKFKLNGYLLHKKVDVYIIEIDKDFGDTTEKTIEVKLGNIY